MNKTAIGVISFVIGAVIGGMAGYIVNEKRNAKLTKQEIDSVKKALRPGLYNNIIMPEDNPQPRKEEYESSGAEPSSPAPSSNKDYSKYTKVVEKYKQKTDTISTSEEPKIVPRQQITIVSSDLLSEDWDVYGVTLYADNVVTDEYDEVVDDPEAILGDALTYFDREANEAMYIENRDEKKYYEISYSNETYAELFGCYK